MHYLYARKYKRLFVASALFISLHRDANGIVILEGNLTVSHKGNHIFAIRTGQPTPQHLPKKTENLCLHKNLYVIIYSYFINI